MHIARHLVGSSDGLEGHLPLGWVSRAPGGHSDGLEGLFQVALVLNLAIRLLVWDSLLARSLRCVCLPMT